MSNQAENLLRALRKATKETERLRSDNQSLLGRLTESIAVVGIGCRFPGEVIDPASFWRLLDQGVDAISEVPRARWDIDAWYDPDPDAQGKMTTRWGGFVSGIDRFEPGFFGISPREAATIDPQQRLLLETSWEALERAGQTMDRLMGSDAGVFIGLCGTDFQTRAMADAHAIDAYSLLGTAHSAIVGRLSYWLGLKGPNVAVDTACSSSLVTVHLACQALRQGECSLALAGGVNIVLSPEGTVYFSRLRALSPTGRCHTFAAEADGYVRSEGCGVVVLKRLSDAQRDGDPILAVIRGSAVNQDGRSNGLTAPNGPSQQAVIQRALAQAGVAGAELDYVECHGTGTSLGDPIEVQALAAVLGKGRAADHPVVIGSAKSNIGHTEGAAGIAGFIKTVLSIQHSRIPKSLHFSRPNPYIPWSELPVKVASEPVAWPKNGVPRRAGVSSFGFSGTNAHVVLEEAPEVKAAVATPARGCELVVLSAKSEAALSAQAAALSTHLSVHEEQSLGDVAYSLATTRSAMEHRLALSVSSRASLQVALAVAAVGQTPAGAVRGTASSSGKLAFLFTGQGSQVPGMGRGLYEGWAAFREAFDVCATLFEREQERPLREVMWSEEGSAESALLDQTAYTQSALFALEVSLAALWRSWGVVPELLAGHSIGELAAAYEAGVFSLEDAVRLVAARGRLMQALPAGGAMVSIAAPEADVAAAVAAHAEQVSMAAVNGPQQVVIAGETTAVTAIAEGFASRGVRTKSLRVSHAFHSPLMAPMLEGFQRVAESVRYRRPTVTLVSNVSGTVVTDEVMSAEYWVRHVREAVRFADGVRSLHEAGARTYVEIGPKATLLSLVPESLGDAAVALIPSLRADRAEAEAALSALGSWYVRGGAVDWKGVCAEGARRVELPTYPWQRERYWIETPLGGMRGGETTGHPLLGMRVPVAGTGAVFETELGLASHVWLSDHRVAGRVLLPGAAVAELVRAAASHGGSSELRVTGLVLQAPLVLPESGARRVQVVRSETTGGATTVSMYSQPAESGAEVGWTLHATGTVAEDDAPEPGGKDVAALQRRCAEELDVDTMYTRFDELGLAYGPSFRGLRSLRRGEGESLAEVALPAGMSAEGYGVHPALLDAAFHAVLAAVPNSEEELLLPFALGGVAVHRAGAEAAWVHAQVRGTGGAGVVADVTLIDVQGSVLAEVTELRLQRADREALGRVGTEASHEAFYRLSWREAPLADAAPPSETPEGKWLVVGAPGSVLASQLASELEGSVSTDVSGLEAALAGTAAIAGVVCLWESAEAEETPAAAQRVAVEGLSVVKAVQRHAPARLVWVTTCAVSMAPGEAVEVATTTAWGLGRTVMQEYPELGCTLVDLGEGVDLGASMLARELSSRDGESQVAWRGGRRHVARLVRAEAVAESRAALCTESTVLVTGGLGALGLHVARWLAGEGVAHLVLTGRRGLDTPGAAEAVAELEALGARVTVAGVDVAEREALGGVIAAIPSAWPLRGVVHAAGVLDDGLLLEQTAERFARVFTPKVGGAWNLHELTAQHELDFFVLFSSASGLLGAAGQGNYAAANTFLDGLAVHRRAQGLPGQSLAWGPWSEGGMASGLGAAQQARLARQGMSALSAVEGIALFASALGRAEAQLGVIALDLKVVGRALGASVPPVWRSLVQASSMRPSVASAQEAWATRLSALSPERRTEEVRAAVQAEVARVLSLSSPGAVPLDRPLSELGLDSLMAVELRKALGQRVGVTLPATIAFDYPTVDALTRRLLEDVTLAPKAPAKASPKIAVDEPIAIVGIGCRYPGGVTSPESFWRLLDESIDATTEVPKERWDIDALYDADPDARGKMMTRRGGFVERVDQFEPSFFGISPREAVDMDPQQRLLLETSWEAIERAGIVPEQLMGSDTGVFVGLMYQDYATLGGGLDALEGYVGTGSAGSIASGRISYVLGLKGPSLTVDTACSSSLVTVHLACQALRQGECSLALAGAAALMLTPAVFVEFSRLRGLSPDGRCKSFSAAADGVAWSEGCGMLVLKRLSDAQRDGDPILAVIRGSAVNQDGRSNGLTAPNGPSQQAVIQRALAQAGVAGAELDYVECHGTGTSLGDPIEVQALGAALGAERSRERPVWIGSVKSNMGHTQAAAGVAGIMKVVLSMGAGRIPKNLHFDEPSPHIPWSELPVKVVSEAVAWPKNGVPRRAGVSSFGISGTNAHVVLEEAPEAEAEARAEARAPRACELVVLSAKSEAALSAQAAALSTHLSVHEEQSLGDVAYSLATTRSAMEHRLALSVSSRASLQVALAVAAVGQTPAGAVRGTASSSGKLAFLFTGQGSQVPGMGRGLYEGWAAFREAFDVCATLFEREQERPLREVMWSEEGSAESALLDQTAYTQSALFALEVSLAALWRSWGVVPELVAGHSIGELAAAYEAGVFSLEDAVRLVAARGRLMQALPAGGAMVSIAAPEADVAAAVAAHAEVVSMAAVNGPQQVVIAGETRAVTAIAEGFASRGVRTKTLRVSHAFHSPLMAPMLEGFQRVAESVRYRRPTVTLVSNVSGRVVTDEVMSAEYWVRHVREAVRFADGVRSLHEAGARTYVEIGPKATLLGLVPESLGDAAVALIPSLRADRAEAEAALSALGSWYVRGGAVDWKGVCAEGARRVELPTYPWQRERYWVTAAKRSTPHDEEALEATLGRLMAQGTLSEAARAAVPELLAALERETAAADTTVARLFHTVAWRESAKPDAVPNAAGRWMVLANASDGSALSAALTRAGGTPVRLEDAQEIQGLCAHGSEVRGVICAFGVEGIGSGEERVALAVLHEVAALGDRAPRVYLVTRGAVSTGPADPPRQPEQAVLWGLGRAFALEHPQAWGALLDLPSGPLDENAADLTVALLVGADGEDQLAVRAGGVFVPRLAPSAPPSTPSRRFKTAGTVLVTGGLGGLGLQVARWLAKQGVRRLLLTGRRGLATPGADAIVAELRALGAEAVIAAADVADRSAMVAALQTLPDGAPISAVFHSAGLADTTPLGELTPERFAETLAAKREGTRILEELTAAYPLDAFVCFSSVAGVWGAGRQAAYSGANAFLDAWAQAARAAGRSALSVSWGPWEGEGMVDESARTYLERRGLRLLSPRRALQALERALVGDEAHVVVVDADWRLFRETLETFRSRPLLVELGQETTASAPSEPTGYPLVETLAGLSPVHRENHLRDWLVGECVAVMGHAHAADVDPQRGFFDMGMDSLMAVQLRKRLERGLGLRLSTAVTFDHPNIETLSRYLLDAAGLNTVVEELVPSPATDRDRNISEIGDADLLALLDKELALAEARMPL